jgi:cytochrome P450
MLPPGPREPALAQTMEWAWRPLPFMRRNVRRFGDAITLRFVGLNFGPVVVVSSPALNKEVFTGDAAVLQAGQANHILLPLLGRRSVLLLDGDEHLRHRKLLLPPFHGERMQAYAEVIRQVTERAVAGMPRKGPFALLPIMQDITFRVILRAVFGLDEGEDMERLSLLLMEMFTPPSAILSLVPALHRDFPGSPFRAFLRRRARADHELYALIERRRKAPAGQDIFSLLLSARDEAGQAMTNEELRDELVTLLAAGHDTTATSLTWAFERILADPRVLERLRSDGDEYLDAVVKETLRHRPILPMVVRKLAAPWKLGDWELPAGAAVAPCIWLTHMRPDLYPNPEAFRPERFVGAKIDPYAWLPFGGGTRRCIGMAFAMYEMKIVLSTILGAAKLRLHDRPPLRTVRRSITLAPKGGTRVVMV